MDLRAEKRDTSRLTTVFLGVVPVALVLSVAFEAVHRRWAGIDLSEPVQGLNHESEAGQGMRVSSWMDGVWPLAKQFFVDGPNAGLGQFLFLSLLALSLFRLFMSWCHNVWQRDFWDCIENKRTSEFWRAMLLFLLMAIVNVLVSTYSDYVRSIICIRWRASLTMSLQERWLVGRAYCLQHFPPSPGDFQLFDNPDQRLQEDVNGFVTAAIGIFFGLVASIGGLLVFTPVLFALSPSYAFGAFYCPGWLLYVSLLYSCSGSIASHVIGQYLVPLNFLRQQVEANYRHSAVEVRDHTESIAMYGSEGIEHTRLSRHFDTIQRMVWEQMKFEKHLGFFRNFYFLANDVVPFCILAGNYFKGQITLGQMMQILGALGHVQNSLNGFVAAYPEITAARATVDRLWGFWKAVDAGSRYVAEVTIAKELAQPEETAALTARDIVVELPGRRILWDRASLVVQPGERILLLGRDGCGKSVFLRALNGCWPARGAVRLNSVKGGWDALFVPQKPFVPAGSLHEAIAYPDASDRYSEGDVRDALRAVQLSSLEHVPLEEHADWQKRLSGGEQQRLAFAHVLLKQPSLLVLDETTSAIGEAEAAELYKLLAARLPPATAVITVDHEVFKAPGLAEWHTTRLMCDPVTNSWVPVH